MLQFLVLAAVVATLSCSERRAGPKVLFVGIDGATWKVIGPMLDAGELPAFRRLIESGAWTPEFETLPVTLSPVIWTTIATGRALEDHGVTSFTSTLPNGQLIPVTSSVRRARAIWEIATNRGTSVGVVGWWASWPAEQVNGYVVSDHANPAFLELLSADKRYLTADPKTLAKLKRDFLPVEIAPVLARHWMTREQFPWRDLQQRGGFTDAQIAEAKRAPWNDRGVYAWLKTFYRIDYPMLRVAQDLARERPTDLQMLYLRGPDPIQHYGWDLHEPQAFARKPQNLERDRGVIAGVYRYLDSFLAEILEGRRKDSWLIVASDHGAEPTMYAADPNYNGRPGEHGPHAKGVLFIAGPHVKKATMLTRATPYDVMPTLAWLLGLPIADDLPGKPLLEAFDGEFVRSHPPARVRTYGARPAGPLLPSAADAEMLESLKGLGYLQ